MRSSLYMTALVLGLGCSESRSSSCDVPPKAVMKAPASAPSTIKKTEKPPKAENEERGKARLVWELSFSSDGKRLATSGDEGTHVWDATTGAHLIELSSGLP